MKHGITQALYSYWNTLRGTRPSPNRSEVDPGKIRSLLGDTFILDASDPDEVRYHEFAAVIGANTGDGRGNVTGEA